MAEEILRKMVKEFDCERRGLVPARTIRDAGKKLLAEHLDDYVADLEALGRSTVHIRVSSGRVPD